LRGEGVRGTRNIERGGGPWHQKLWEWRGSAALLREWNTASQCVGLSMVYETKFSGFLNLDVNFYFQTRVSFPGLFLLNHTHLIP
jgi:hypothetical protein